MLLLSTETDLDIAFSTETMLCSDEVSTVRMCIDQTPDIVFTCCRAGCLGAGRTASECILDLLCLIPHAALLDEILLLYTKNVDVTKHMILDAVSRSIDSRMWITTTDFTLLPLRSPANHASL